MIKKIRNWSFERKYISIFELTLTSGKILYRLGVRIYNPVPSFESNFLTETLLIKIYRFFMSSKLHNLQKTTINVYNYQHLLVTSIHHKNHLYPKKRNSLNGTGKVFYFLSKKISLYSSQFHLKKKIPFVILFSHFS